MAPFSDEMVSPNKLKFANSNGSNYRVKTFNMRLFLEYNDLFEHGGGTANRGVLRNFSSQAKEVRTYMSHE